MLCFRKWDGEFLADITQRHAELFLETHLPFENRPWPRHSSTRKQRGVNAVPCRIRERHALPMGELAYARLTHRCASHTCDVHRMTRFLRVEFHQTRAG